MKYKMIKEIEVVKKSSNNNIKSFGHDIDREMLVDVLEKTMTDTDDPDMRGKSPVGYVNALLSGKFGDLKSLIILIAEDKGDYVAIAIAVKNHEFYHLTSLGVTRAYRGKGLGSLMMDQMLMMIAKRQEKHLALNVHSMNFPALALYKKYGFKLKL